MEENNSQIDDTTQYIKYKRKLSKLQIVGIIAAVIVGLAILCGLVFSVYKVVKQDFPPQYTVDRTLVETANASNKFCPMMIDVDTRLDNVMALPNKLFVYNYTLVNYENGMIDTIVAKSHLEQNIVTNVATHPDMQDFREMEVTLKYLYKDKNGKYMFSIIVTPEQYK